MIIKRVQVEEGFLDGLDLSFCSGLNVLIGPRGTGKTSIIELIRFCLDVPAYTELSQKAATQHALSILGPGGQVTVTFGVPTNSRELIVTRAVGEDSARASGTFPRPTILSQNEIESVGLQTEGRLHLIDGFFSEDDGAFSESPALAQIRSLTSQLHDLRQEISDLRLRLTELEQIGKELVAAEQTQTELTASVAASTADQQQLRKFSDETTKVAVKADVLSRTLDTLNKFKRRVEASLVPPPKLEGWPAAAGSEDALRDVGQLLDRAVDDVRTAITRIDQGIKQVTRFDAENSASRVQTDEAARQIRRRLEQLQEGAGASARRIADLRERLAQLNALADLKTSKEEQIAKLIEERAALLDAVDKTRERRYRVRAAIAARLTEALKPAIEVSVARAVEHSQYVAALTGALRGSGLHYNTLAPALAAALSPRELVEAIERGDFDVLLRFSGLTPDRAIRLATYLQGQHLGGILTSPVEDGVTLRLLTGTEYKTTETLSTGQRCTVVLPILLARESGALIVDQPEDHLDNAFVVSTLVKAIRANKASGQLIFSTHNPNIPVLGDADLVVLLGSDGRKGFIVHAAPLDSPASVAAIAAVMEGGRDAFARRAQFYRGHPV